MTFINNISNSFQDTLYESRITDELPITNFYDISQNNLAAFTMSYL